MSKIDALVQDFLAQKKIAVVGVSDKRETGCNAGYRRFKAAGYTVSAVNPRLTTFEGEPCYPDLKSIPDQPEAVFILANPKVTDQIVQQCVDLGIKHVWMHCMMGTKPGAAREHDQRLARSRADVPRQRHRGDPRQLPESIPAAGLRPHDDAGDVPHAWLHACRLTAGNSKCVIPRHAVSRNLRAI